MIARTFKLSNWLLLSAAVVFLAGHSTSSAASSRGPQEEKPIEEVVANLAAGRVIVGVFKDGIIIATVENAIEPGSLTPPIVPFTNRRAGVVLGAAEFVSPSSRQVLVKLSVDLPHVRGDAPLSTQQPHLIEPGDAKNATDIEQIGLGLMNRLNESVSQIHSELHFSANDPLTQVVLADYIEGYGPEVWFLTYTIQQVPERGDFWTTRVRRPRYVQFYPPEKKDPHTLMEFDYPPEADTVTLRDMMLAHDPRLEKLRTSSPEMAGVVDSILRGDLEKSFVASGVPYFKAATDAIAPGSRKQIAVLGLESGFSWVVAPPREAKPRTENAADGQAAPTSQRPADAPTLQKP